MTGITVRRKLALAKPLNKDESDTSLQVRLPRITKLMALAIKFDQMIRDGIVKDQAELARLGHVTRARMTQIMMLNHLAPEIQEALLFLPPVEAGRDLVIWKQLQSVSQAVDWMGQRRAFDGLGQLRAEAELFYVDE